MTVCTFLAASAAIWLAIAGNAAAQTPKCKLVRIAEWPVRVDQYRPVVDGAINGQKIGILLDTGAARSLLRRSAATLLDLTRYEADGTRLFGIGGESGVEAVLLDEFSIGQARRRNWRVLVAGEHEFGGDADFILGDDFFNQVDVEFDLNRNEVRLFQAKDCESISLAYWTTEAAGEVALEPGSQIRLTIAINGKPVRAELDSGSITSLLATSEAARLGVTPQSPGVLAQGCARGLGRKPVEIWSAPFESFAIGNEIIRNPRIRISDLWKHTTFTETGSRLPSHFAGLPQMLLGVDFLRAHRVLVAHSQRKIYFSYTGGTVFPSGPPKTCNDDLPVAPPAKPPPQQQQR